MASRDRAKGRVTRLVTVDPRYAELHPEAVTKKGRFFYRPAVSALEMRAAEEKGERSFETFARILKERQTALEPEDDKELITDIEKEKEVIKIDEKLWKEFIASPAGKLYFSSPDWKKRLSDSIPTESDVKYYLPKIRAWEQGLLEGHPTLEEDLGITVPREELFDPILEASTLEEDLGITVPRQELGLDFPEIIPLYKTIMALIGSETLLPIGEGIQALEELIDTQADAVSQKLIAMGRTPETVALLRFLIPEISETDLTDIFQISEAHQRGRSVARLTGYPRGQGLGGRYPAPLESQVPVQVPVVEPFEFSAPFSIPKTAEEKRVNQQVFSQYRKQGGKLAFDQWRRETALKEAEVTGELREDVLRKLASLPITAEAKRMRVEFANTSPLAAQFMAGWGDVIGAGAAGAKTILGQDKLAQSFRELAAPLRDTIRPPEMPELSWKSARDPRFWGNLPGFLVRNTPFTLALVPAMISGYTGVAAIAGAFGLGTFGTMILGFLGATALQRPIEGILEAGGAYDYALARDMSPEEADRVAQGVFLKNLTLSGLDVAQLALAFLPTPAKLLANSFLRTVFRAGKVVVTGLTEGGEEFVQEVFVRQELGDPVELDQNMKLAILLGGVMGSGMGATGAAFTTIVDRTVQNIPADAKAKFYADIDEGVRNVLTEEQAILVALDKFSQIPEGATIIKDVVQQIQKEDAEMQIEASKKRQAEIVPPEAEGEVTAEEISQVTATARATGAIGAKAITAKFVGETSQIGESILDYGSGKQPIHTLSLREQGFDVTAFDIGANVVEGVHDVNALDRTYDTVSASNVINVAPSETFLRKTLGDIKSATKDNGRALLNYPVSPRKLGLSNTEMEAIITEFFPSVERVGGTAQAPLWEARIKPPAVEPVVAPEGVKPPSEEATLPVTPTPTKGVEPVRFASTMSSGGTVEAGLRPGSIASVHTSELSLARVQAYNQAFGTNYTARNIIDEASLRLLQASNASHYHASPVCKNFTKAKVIKTADPNDLAIARAVARDIREVKPPTVSMENVPAYKDTALFKLITKELDDAGYNWDWNIVNAADYGAAQNRTRLILRAVRKDVGELPALPPARKGMGADWYPLLEDLIDAEIDAGKAIPLAEILKAPNPPGGEISRIRRYIGLGKLDENKPIITMGGSASKGVPFASNAGSPAPTLLATERQVPRIIIPGARGLADATVVRVTPRMMKRLMGLPESYALPENRNLAKNILGDGVHGAITKNFIQPLVDIHQRSATKPVVPPVEVKPPTVEEVVAEVEGPDAEVRRQFNELQKMSDIWRKKLADREQVKSQLAKFVRENLPANVRGRYVTAVAKVRTDAQLGKQINRVQEFAEQNSQKVLRAEIRKELKKAKAKIKEHILRGKFTPDVQRRLDVLIHNLEIDRDVAREKMVANIQAFDADTLSYEEMLKSNELLNFAGIEGMSSEELANTLEYIKLLELIGRSNRQAKQEAATERIKATRSDISGILTGGKGLKTGIGAIPRGELIAKTGWWDAFTNWQYGIDNLADKLSKFDPTSQPFQSELSKFVAQVHRATNRQVISTKEAYNKVKDIVKEVYKVKSNRDVNQMLNGLEEEVNLGTFALTEEYKANHPDATTVTIKMARDEMIAKYMQLQDSTLDNAFKTGMGWSQDVRDAVEANLTAEEKALAEAYFKFYEDYYQGISDIYSELYNVDMPKNAVYSPRFRDFEGDVTENVLTLQDAQRFAGVTAQSIKARKQNSRPIKFNGATKLLSNHIEQMEHFKAWATTMRDMRRVFGSTEIRQAVEQYHGRGVLEKIDTFLNQMARDGIETATTNRVADFLRRNFTKSILAIKPVILLKQIPSLFGYISEMNTVDFFTGIYDYWTAPIKNFKFLYNNSKGFRARVSLGHERDIRAAKQKHGKQLISGRGQFTDWFLLQIQLGDAFAVTQGMWAKYKAGRNQGLSQEEAIAAAEDTTGRTQPSFGIDTLSALQNAGSWAKLMIMFQNQPNKYFRIVGDNLRNFNYGRGSRAKAASTILLAWVVLPMMFQYIADAFQWKPERQARAGILGQINHILIGGQIIQSMWGWLTDQPFDYQVSPVVQTGRDLQMMFLKAGKLVGQHLDPYKDISTDDVAALVEYLAKATGQVTGLPTPYFVQVEKGIRRKLAEGEDINIKDFLFSQWALTPPEKKAEEKVEDLNLLLGEPEEGAEDKPLTDKPLKIYDTADWLRDIGKVYDNVLPQDVLDDPTASKESKAWAMYEIARSQADILPDMPLYKINTEDNDDTIRQYYQQWRERKVIESLAKLKEHDKRYPKAYLGNVTRQQYDVLKKYLEAEDKDTFLTEHPALRINPRNEWLKANPTDNAYLVLGEQAKILTMEAYKETRRLIKELDIPDDAIPKDALFELSETAVGKYFKYQELLEQGFDEDSLEAQLLKAQDNELREFLGHVPIETPIRALELKIKHRKLSDQYDAFGDRDSPQYIEDDDARKEARDKLKIDDPEGYQKWVDDKRRIEAIENKASDAIVESWVERGREVDEFSGSSAEAKVWLLDNLGVLKWAKEKGLVGKDNPLYSSDWNEKALRLKVKHRDATDLEKQYKDKYDANGEKNPLYIEDSDKRQDELRKELGEEKYQEWVDDKRRIQAFEKDEALGAYHAEAWVSLGRIIDKDTANSSEAKVFMLDNWRLYDWAIASELLSDRREELLEQEPILRIDVEWAENFDRYDAATEEISRLIKNKKQKLAEWREEGKEDAEELARMDKAISVKEEAREKMLFTKLPTDSPGELSDFGEAYYKKLASSKGYSEGNWEIFAAFSAQPQWGSWQERFLVAEENKAFYAEYVSPDIGRHGLVAETEMKPLIRDQIYGKFLNEYKAWDETAGMTKDEIKTMRDKLLTVEKDGMSYNEIRYRVNAYDKFFPENLIDDFVEWFTNTALERPEGYPEDLGWYEDDWWLQERPKFLAALVATGIWKKPRDFSLVPSREVFDKYLRWRKLASDERKVYQGDNKDLEDWLLRKGYITRRAGGKVIGEISPRRMGLVDASVEISQELEEMKRNQKEWRKKQEIWK